MEEARRLCREALDRFGPRCFDNLAVAPGRLDAVRMRLIADALMVKGGREAFLLGRRIHDLLAAVCP